ncbi:MAG: molybdate ABC transporter substrate-binding protein, partial [Planctomycetaceae bacterium]
MKRILFALLLVCFILPDQPALARADETITVFAASSLTDAFEEIGAAFEAENPGVDVVFNFGSSSSLATQLAEGAPADVFASANPKQMQVAQDAGRITGSPRIFARNRLAVIVPADNPAGIESVTDLAKPGLLLVLAAPGIPVRDYTDTMLDQLGEDMKSAVLANLVSEEDNVRQVVAKVALGEADAG